MEDMGYGEIWRFALDAQLPVLQQNLLLDDNFYGYLIQKRIFTHDTIQKIKSETSSDAKILRLVGLLKTRDNNCFENFLSILESTNNRFIQEIIDQSIRSYRINRKTEDTKLSELLKLKDRQLQELEQELSDLAKRLTEAEQIVKMEMARSKHYMEVITRLTAVRPLATQSVSIDESESELEDMAEEMDNLKEQVDALETQLQWTKEDLDKTKLQLNNVIESEKMMKRNLGLREDAEETEVMARIQEMKHDQSLLKKTQNELNLIIEKRDTYMEKLWRLTQEVKRMDRDRRQKDLKLQRMMRHKEDYHIIQTARSVLSENKHNHPIEQRVLEEMNLPRIDIGTRLLSARRNITNGKLSSSHDFSVRSQLQTPNSNKRGSYHTPSNAPGYCVLCRNDCYVHEPCRIHTEAKRNGRYPCCNLAASGARAMGCRTLPGHLYVQFSAIENECRLYDEHGRTLRLRSSEHEDKKQESIFVLSGR